MYNTTYFKEKDLNVILDFIHQHPFAFLTGSFANGKQVVTQIPVLLEEKNGEYFLQAHLMRNTDHHKAFSENQNALVVFSGPHAYVSATWYSDAKMGSTWNYMSVHAAGQVRFMSNEEMNRFMRKFTLRFEGGNDQSPTVFDNLPAEYSSRKMPAIVGIEIKIDNLDNVFKLSQNKDEESYRKIINKLELQGGNASVISSEMKKRLKQLFKT